MNLPFSKRKETPEKGASLKEFLQLMEKRGVKIIIEPQGKDRLHLYVILEDVETGEQFNSELPNRPEINPAVRRTILFTVGKIWTEYGGRAIISKALEELIDNWSDFFDQF